MKNTCRMVMAELPDLIEGKLGEEASRLVQRHLEECSDCRKEEENVRAIYAALSSRPPFSLPPKSYWGTIVPRIHERIDRRHSGFRLVPGWAYRVVLPAAAVTFLIVVLFRSDLLTPSAASDDLWKSVQQMSVEERVAVLNDYGSALPESIEDYTVTDSIMVPLRSDAAEVMRSETNEYNYEYQFAPETLLESLSTKEVEQVISKLQTQQHITS
jgi:hypothetical protein